MGEASVQRGSLSFWLIINTPSLLSGDPVHFDRWEHFLQICAFWSMNDFLWYSILGYSSAAPPFSPHWSSEHAEMPPAGCTSAVWWYSSAFAISRRLILANWYFWRKLLIYIVCLVCFWSLLLILHPSTLIPASRPDEQPWSLHVSSSNLSARSGCCVFWIASRATNIICVLFPPQPLFVCTFPRRVCSWEVWSWTFTKRAEPTLSFAFQLHPSVTFTIAFWLILYEALTWADCALTLCLFCSFHLPAIFVLFLFSTAYGI